MSNTAYPLGAQAILAGSINLDTDVIKACLLTTSYTFSALHQFVAALGTRVGTDQTLANTSVTNGVFDADDLNFGAIAPGSTIKALVIYKDTGNTATSPVLFYYDVLAGFPMATNGGAVTVPWDDGVKKIARLNAPFFPKGGQKQMSAAINWSSDNIKAALLPDSYTHDDTDEFLADLGGIIGSAVALANKTITGGVFDADDVSFGAIAGGSTIGSMVLFKDSGNPATSPLLLHITDDTGVPMTTNGSAIGKQWSNGAAKIFSLIPA